MQVDSDEATQMLGLDFVAESTHLCTPDAARKKDSRTTRWLALVEGARGVPPAFDAPLFDEFPVGGEKPIVMYYLGAHLNEHAADFTRLALLPENQVRVCFLHFKFCSANSMHFDLRNRLAAHVAK